MIIAAHMQRLHVASVSVSRVNYQQLQLLYTCASVARITRGIREGARVEAMKSEMVVL